ncbi:hypothetical protein WP50_23555 [Lactiplantibacillus plantarum]|nr:hypothetical protein WP50_23555 [Lactiplantibacillus plantarum]
MRRQEKFVQVFEDGKQTPTAFEMQYLKHDLNLQNTPDQLTYLQAVLQQLAQLSSSVEQDLYLNQLVAEFDLDKDDLKQQLRSLVGQQAVRRGGGHSDEPQVAPPPAPAPLGPPPATVDGSTNSGPLSRVEKAERLLLYRLLNDHDVWLRVMAIAGFHFVHDSYQQILVYAEAGEVCPSI